MGFKMKRHQLLHHQKTGLNYLILLCNIIFIGGRGLIINPIYIIKCCFTNDISNLTPIFGVVQIVVPKNICSMQSFLIKRGYHG